MLIETPFSADMHAVSIKHIYRAGRASNYQSNTDMENYEIQPLNKPITAIISQHT